MQEAKFIVSARKYRPQTFDTVVGQGHITTTLKNAIRHRQLGHAFLFCGPRGVGKPPVPAYWQKP
jgi:DNA polymerase-3 subunit gamma/tau